MASSHENPPSKRRRIILVAVVCALVLLLVYAASPYVSFWRFTVALRSNDTTALSSRVDFPAVRESLKAQLIKWFSPAGIAETPIKNKRLARLARSITPEFINVMVDAYITPEGLRALITDPKAVKEIRSPQQLHMGQPVDWSKVRYAFFASPRVFVVNLEGVKLRFRFSGLRWRLDKVDLGLSKAKS
jgi:Protein of unknown function (DUF2939).